MKKGEGKEMKKDIEWLKNYVDETETAIKSLLDGATTYNTKVSLKGSLATLKDFRGYIDQLDEPEVLSQKLPVIPRYVADWIKEEQGTMSNWKLPSRFISDSKYKKDQRRYKWSQVEGNMDKFMSALINSYEVEKEKLYVVELSNSNEKFGNYENVFLNKKDGVVFIDSCRLFINDIKKYSQFGLTEKEIKDFDPRFWPFAEPVDEVV